MNPPPHLHRPTPLRSSDSGFALIASLSIMAVLVMIAVALYSMSSVATRSAAIASARVEAQANAKVALMMAIGELQKQMGPDQRISANAGILDTAPDTTVIDGVANPHWLGIWDSWVAGDPADAPVNSNYPSSTVSHHQTIGNQPDDSMHPEYDSKDDYFRRWLVSLIDPANQQNPEIAKFPLIGEAIPQKSATAVQLVGKGSLSPTDPGAAIEATEFVSAQLIEIDGDNNAPRGRYAWWVGDESQKAMIMDNSYQASSAQSLAEKLFRQQAPASLGNAAISGLENVADQAALSFIPSRDTLPLVNGTTRQVTEQFHHVTTHSFGVLADVREGGLKRDLSTILEREIDPEDVYNLTGVEDFERASSLKPDGADFMLYNFDDLLNSSVGNTGEAAVPIQDLAAYYQLYDRYRPGSKGGIQYSSSESSPPNNELTNGIMVSNPDYGRTQSDLDKYLRQYTSLYRRPVPVKIEMILSYSAEQILPVPTGPDDDTHNLRLGISPAITFWNPNNVPIVMNLGVADEDSLMMREIPIPLKLSFMKSKNYAGPFTENDDWERQMGQVTSTQQGELYSFFVSGNYPAVFEPGESKVFALRYASYTDSQTASNDVDFKLRGQGARYNEEFVDELELVPGWNPDKFIRARVDGSARGGDPIILTFKADDYISVTIEPGQNSGVRVEKYSFGNVFLQKSRHGRKAPGVKYHFHSFDITGRINNGNDSTFTDGVVYRGFPLSGSGSIVDTTPRSINIPAKNGQDIIDALGNPFTSLDDLALPFFYYGIKAATETHESNSSEHPEGAGRRFVTRPFTHSTAIAPAFIDLTDPTSLYNYPWNWFFMSLDNMSNAPIAISGGNSGYYGGGYTADMGVTHIVQQQLPLTPPISIATLSHAHLGGFSLGTEPARQSTGENFSRTTALGHGGLAPHTLQAIGNSYAHPNIPPENAWTTWTRQFEGSNRVDEPFADHSYLANKALWDEFFFSSISPKPGASEAFSEDKTAEEVANAFFFVQEALPNPRIVPNFVGITQTRLDNLFDDYDLFKDGFADKIATHLMVEGPFNINSTSVTAWKALFSSLKGQSISYLDAKSALVVGTNLDFDNTEGVPIPGGPLPNGKGYQGSSSEPSDPEQWTGFRELTETEIEELANAMVAQVKLRGPFLSLSEFVNRRLDANSTEFALKGALQAAIDDPDVSINAGFRDPIRQFTSEEISFMESDPDLAFEEAMEGPIAYGSSAYVDQADLLKNFPAQLTPRGDTFVIRAYGDSLDGQGQNVQARAWCEAVVQRVPDYVDPSSDEAYEKQSELSSEANQNFGRQFRVVSFRWLSPSEI